MLKIEDVEWITCKGCLLQYEIERTTCPYCFIANPKEPHVRPSWDQYFMEVANAISRRATCDRGRSGCVIAKDEEILVTGYVGSPRGFPHCDEVGHEMRRVLEYDKEGSLSTEHCVRTVHAEQNAIYQAARKGVSIVGSTMYCRMTPCRICAMAIIQCGIKRVVCEKKYQKAEESEKMFEQARIYISYVYDEVQQYPGEKNETNPQNKIDS